MERLRACSRRSARSLLVGIIFLHLLGCAGDPPPAGDSSDFPKMKQKRMEIIHKEYRGSDPAAK
jgi:hypothetical protein